MIDIAAAFATHSQRLAAMTFPEAVDVGDRAPNFELPNAHGETVDLGGLLAEGPVVLTFYRGAWCPYCNTHLRALQQLLGEIESHGATLVAISPQLPDGSLALAEQHGLTFEVLSDVGSYVASDYGITFALGAEDRDLFRLAGNDLAAVNGDESWLLPVPATFVISPDGVVRHADVEADYTRRIDPEELLSALRAVG